MRWLIEGTWSGYRSSQSRVCHRTIIRSKRTADSYAKLKGILFTDNTTMTLTMRPMHRSERVKEIHGYDSLLRDCVYGGHEGFVSVESLRKPEPSAQEVKP